LHDLYILVANELFHKKQTRYHPFMGHESGDEHKQQL